MENILYKLFRTHFYILCFLIIHSFIQSETNFGLNNLLIFALKVFIYISGVFFFFKFIKPFKVQSIYFSFYFITFLFLLLGKIFGGTFIQVTSLLFSAPLHLNKNIYEEKNLELRSTYAGILASCCEYEIVKNRFLFFEERIGSINIGEIEENIEPTNCNFQIENEKVIFSYKNEPYEIY